jgi:LysR family transcriptional regulator, transcriptional activator of nhaA
LRWETDDYLVKRKIRKTIAFESNVVGAILRATIDGHGIGFLPEPYLIHELESQDKTRGALIVSREPLWNHRIYVSARNRSASEENRLMLTTLAHQLEP